MIIEHTVPRISYTLNPLKIRYEIMFITRSGFVDTER